MLTAEQDELTDSAGFDVSKVCIVSIDGSCLGIVRIVHVSGVLAGRRSGAFSRRADDDLRENDCQDQ